MTQQSAQVRRYARISEILDDALSDSDLNVYSSPSKACLHKKGIQKGDVLDGKYRIERMIGQGGMGEVYEAFELSLNRRVAIKVIQSAYASIPAFQKRFRREAQTMAQVSHPNIVSIHHCEVRDDALSYIVMEYVEGKTLAEILKVNRKLSDAVAISLCKQILRALHAIHSKGIIHRDLKPANIILTEEGGGYRVRICDFGLGKMLDQSDTGHALTELTEVGCVLGTPSYMSPEQCRGDKLSESSDIYSLGIILFEMLTGRTPFTGGSKQSIMIKHLTAQLPFEYLREDVPRELRAVLERALMKNHRKRYGRPIEMIRALSEVKFKAPKRSFSKIALVATVILLMLGMGAYLALGVVAPDSRVSIGKEIQKSPPVTKSVDSRIMQPVKAERALEPRVEAIPQPITILATEWSRDPAALFHQAQAYGDSGNQELQTEALRRFVALCGTKWDKACSAANRRFAHVRSSGQTP